MATNLGQAYVQIVPSAKGIAGSIRKTIDPEASKAGKESGESFGKKMIRAAGKIGIGLAIGKGIKDSIGQGAELEQTLGGIKKIFGDSSEKMQEYASKAYKTAGVSANDFLQQATSFSASLLQSLEGDQAKAADVANMALMDMSDNANMYGSNIQDIQNAYQGFAKQNYTMLDNLKLGYGGTKSEMQRLLKDAEKLTGVKYDINNLSDVYEAIHEIQDETHITGTTTKEAMGTVQGSIAATQASWKDLLGNMATGRDIKEPLKGVMSSALAVVKNVGKMVWSIAKSVPGVVVEMLKEIIPAIQNFVTTDLPVIIENVKNFISGTLVPEISAFINVTLPQIIDTLGSFFMDTLLPWLLETLPKILEGVSGFITGTAIPWIISTLPELVGSVIDFLMNDFLPNLLKFLGSLLSAIGGWAVSEGIPAILELVGSIVVAIGEVLIELPGKILEWIVGAVEIVGKWAADMAAEALEGIGNWFADMGEKLAQLPGKILEWISGAVGNVATWANDIKDSAMTRIGTWISSMQEKITKIPGQIYDWIKGAVQNVVRWGGDLIRAGAQAGQDLLRGIVREVSKIPGKMFEAGKNLVKGLWNGIKNVTGWIMGKIRGFCDGIVGGIKSFFGIASPSKLFAWIGEMNMAGLGEGMENNLGLVEKSMEDLEGITNREIQTKLSVGTGNQLADINGFDQKIGEGGRLLGQGAPIIIKLILGGQEFKAFVRNITRYQDQVVQLELDY